jgi:hypothetical protein
MKQRLAEPFLELPDDPRDHLWRYTEPHGGLAEVQALGGDTKDT